MTGRAPSSDKCEHWGRVYIQTSAGRRTTVGDAAFAPGFVQLQLGATEAADAAAARRVRSKALFEEANAVLVGQNIGKDVEWLGLREGLDFGSMVDLTRIGHDIIHMDPMSDW